MEQLVIDDLGAPWGDGKHLLKWRKVLGLGQVELADAAGISQTLVSFIETETQPFTESAKGKLWGAILRLGFERAKKGELGNLSEWSRVLTALYEAEEKKRADRNERWEKLQAEAAARDRDRLFGGHSFLTWPENEAEQQRIVEEGQSALELLKLVGGQWRELALADIRKNPEKALEEFSALFEWRQKILDLEAQGYALFLKSDVEAKDKRIAELEQERISQKRVQLSDGQVVAFPEFMADEDIANVLRKHPTARDKDFASASADDQAAYLNYILGAARKEQSDV